MGYQHTPGYAVWKFVFDDTIVYRRNNRDALRFYWKNRDWKPFTIYVRSNSGWNLVTKVVLSDRCQCGNTFETSNGEKFKYQDYPLMMTIESITAMMCSPILCQMCYYKGELKAGRWAPRSVKKQLGLES